LFATTASKMLDQGSLTFLKLQATSCVPINTKGYYLDIQV